MEGKKESSMEVGEEGQAGENEVSRPDLDDGYAT
jgi:hypothetical protein